MKALDYWLDDASESGSVLVRSGSGYPEKCMIQQQLGTQAISFALRGTTINEDAGRAGISANEWLVKHIACKRAWERND